MATLSYRDLIVWQKSMELVRAIYSLSSQLPTHEQFSLTSQMRRSAISVPSNIAEGNCRSTSKDYVRFLYISFGSCAELDTQLQICEMQYPNIQVTSERSLLDEVQKMLNAMVHKIER